MTAQRILIIDDDLDILDFIAMLLQTEGYQVYTASSGGEGLAMAQELAPQLILLDISMPDIGGLDVCATIRAWEENNEMPIVIVSARNSSHDRARARSVGATDYLVKPFRNHMLLEQVNALLR